MLSLGTRPRSHTLADGLKHHVERRDCKYPYGGGEDHPAENRGADAAPRQLRGTRRHDQRKKTEDESERGHHDRTKPQTGAFGGRFEQRNPMLALLLGELDDQNAVLGGQTDQYNHPDLGIEIQRQPEQEDRRKAPKNADRNRKQYRNRNIPAFIQCDQEQIGKQNSEAEYDARPSFRSLLLKRSVGPFPGISRRERFRGYLLERLQSLAGRYSRRRVSLDGSGSKVVVANDRGRADDGTYLDQTAHWDHLSLRIAHIDAINVIDLRPVRGIRLHLHLPRPSEEVHVVDEIASQRGLQCLEDVI